MNTGSSMFLPFHIKLISAPDMEDDIKLLLECLHFQRHSPSSQRQALSTMATMCNHSSKEGK